MSPYIDPTYDFNRYAMLRLFFAMPLPLFARTTYRLPPLHRQHCHADVHQRLPSEEGTVITLTPTAEEQVTLPLFSHMSPRLFSHDCCVIPSTTPASSFTVISFYDGRAKHITLNNTIVRTSNSTSAEKAPPPAA